MRTRFAIFAVLIVGVFACTAGTSFAAGGASGSGSAAGAQYSPPKKTHHLVITRKPGGSTNGGTPSAVEAAGAQRSISSSSSGTGSLPFTGLAVAPLVLIGAALLCAGVVVNRRAGSPRE